jgi:hypothetical protein
VTVGILALHYVTSDPVEKEFAMKQQYDSRKGPRPSSIVQGRTSPKLPSHVAPQTATEERQGYAGDEANPGALSVPHRIFVRKTYDVQFVDAQLPSSNTTSIDKKHLSDEIEVVEG